MGATTLGATLQQGTMLVGQLKGMVDKLIGEDAAAKAAAGGAARGAPPPGITIQAQGPTVNVTQAPPVVTNNVSVNVTSPDQAPEATADAVGNALGNKVRGGMYDGVNE